MRGNQKAVGTETHRNRALRACEQVLAIAAFDEIRHFPARLALRRAVLARNEFGQIGETAVARDVDLVLGQRDGFSQNVRLDVELGAVLEGLETLERLEDVVAAHHDPVIVHHHHVSARLELLGDILAEFHGAGDFVACDAHFSADDFRVGDDPGVRRLAQKTVGDERGRVRVQDAAHVRAGLIDEFMEGKFHRRLVLGEHRSVRLDADDVLPRQRTLVDSAGRDPDVSVPVQNRDISPARRRQTVPIDAVHHHDKLVLWVQQLKFHKKITPSVYDYTLFSVRFQPFFPNLPFFAKSFRFLSRPFDIAGGIK